jgi:hypothetical protein
VVPPATAPTWPGVLSKRRNEGMNGWQTVPTEPTEAMIEAGTREAILNQDRLAIEGIAEIYRAMLETAPSPNQTQIANDK